MEREMKEKKENRSEKKAHDNFSQYFFWFKYVPHLHKYVFKSTTEPNYIPRAHTKRLWNENVCIVCVLGISDYLIELVSVPLYIQYLHWFWCLWIFGLAVRPSLCMYGIYFLSRHLTRTHNSSFFFSAYTHHTLTSHSQILP